MHLTLKFPRNKTKNKGDNFYQKSFNLGNPSGFSPSLGYLLVHLAQKLMSSREKGGALPRGHPRLPEDTVGYFRAGGSESC
jgi:hypothetical protein